MHPLRFPNSGIRTKVLVQKIGFKLRVMRLNRVELFYALIAVIGSESRRCLRGRGGHMHVVCMQRWLATAKPPAGVADCGQAPCKGLPPVGAIARKGRPPTGMAGYGQPAAASPQGVAARGQPYRQQGWQRRSQGWPPLIGRLSTAKGSHCLRRHSDDDGAVRVKEGQGIFFRKDGYAP
ncbi:hypothetical protein GW17_00056904 [Ensete ventricosum]|nr:hypothetical protein GW17_00056904 [Ensete ventricosum]RZS25575.1 hypothetical protein BHM03_00058796 [Ensete ventricosum]